MRVWGARFLGVWGIYSALVVLALISGYGFWAFYFTLPASGPGLWLLFRLPPRVGDLGWWVIIPVVVLGSGVNVALLFGAIAVVKAVRKRLARKPTGSGL